MTKNVTQPVSINDRAEILDIIRGVALAGICIANYPMFSLYIFQPHADWEAMPTYPVDRVMPLFHFIFIDGKFYSIFSLLFGIGFSIQMTRMETSGYRVFYRRIFILALLGLTHSILLWDGDILLLYALMGMLLPLFRNVSNRNLLVGWGLLIFSPLLIDLVKVLTGGAFAPAAPLREAALKTEAGYGITPENVYRWPAEHSAYSKILQYNHTGFFWRWFFLVESNRLVKVLGMFLLGLYVGRNRMYQNLPDYVPLLKKIRRWGFVIGLPASIGFTIFELDEVAVPDPFGLLDAFFYAISVVPLSLAYTSTLCLWYLAPKHKKWMQRFAAPGRTALSNYLLQSLFGVFIFYGIGLGLGAKTGLVVSQALAIVVFLVLMLASHLWLRYFQYGPFEWLWRQLTYGKILSLRKQDVER